MKAFISHSSIDKPLAREIADEIRVRGHDVWLDERDLGPGHPLASALAEALTEIDVFVILVTQNSVSSPWVVYELNQVIALVVRNSVRVLPLKFDGAEIPSVLSGFIYADCSIPDGLRRALNLTFTSARLRLPLAQSELQDRFEKRMVPEFCVRLIRSTDLSANQTLGPSAREYVALGDYFEQCGRPLRDIMTNLFVGRYLEELLEPADAWSAVVFEAGHLYEQKLDLLPGTWKAIYRVLSDRRRLGICLTAKYHDDLGMPPRDYWEGNHREWYDRVRSELQRNGYPLSEDEKFLEGAFGIRSMCFRGDGRGPGSSRIFFALNLPLSDTRHWVVDLGKPTEGRTLN